MAKQRAASMLAAALLLLAAFFAAFPVVVQSIGVCYGVNGKTLPTASDVVQLYRSKGINAMRIYFPESKVLHALTGTGIALVMDVANEDVGTIASGASAAAAWVKANVQAYPGVSFKYIAVGNEVMDADAQSKILPAMKNLHGALSAAGLGGMIKVSTAVRFDVITDSYPPSYGVFKDLSVMAPIVEFLSSTGGPFLANLYPYFAYRDDPQNIQLEYATFLPGTTVPDDNGLNYTNLFDAMVDAVYAALEDAGTPDVRVVVSESGWPSTGGFGANVSNARTYNQKLINHVGEGTPRRPGPLETYMFAMFNENLKTGDEIEKHFGLFNPDKSPAYPISF